MSVISRLAGAIGDRIHHTTPADLATTGLHVQTHPDGRRTVRMPDLPAIATAHRNATLRRGLDPTDRALLHTDTTRPLTTAATRRDHDHGQYCPDCGHATAGTPIRRRQHVVRALPAVRGKDPVYLTRFGQPLPAAIDEAPDMLPGFDDTDTTTCDNGTCFT